MYLEEEEEGAGDEGGEGGVGAEAPIKVDRSTVGPAMPYISQSFRGGADCLLTKKPRTSEVRLLFPPLLPPPPSVLLLLALLLLLLLLRLLPPPPPPQSTASMHYLVDDNFSIGLHKSLIAITALIIAWAHHDGCFSNQ